MLQRVGISMSDQELKHLSTLQKRFGARSRSEFFRELVRRYEKLESDVNALSRCRDGYRGQPESSDATSRAILKASMKNQVFEEWSDS